MADKKVIDQFIKNMKEGIPFSEDLIKGSNDIENNSLLARNLSEEALASEVMKNTGIPIPDKTASLSKKEDSLNRIVNEIYPEFKDPNLRIGKENSYTPSTGGILVNDKHNQDINKMISNSLHEGGHKYDTEILKKLDSKELDSKTLDKFIKSNFNNKDIDPTELYEIYAKGHHAEIPKLREGSYGFGGLKSLLKNGTFKSIIGPLAKATGIGAMGLAAAGIGNKAMAGDFRGATGDALDLGTDMLPVVGEVKMAINPSEMGNSELPTNEMEERNKFNRMKAIEQLAKQQAKE